jgi:Ras family protein
VCAFLFEKMAPPIELVFTVLGSPTVGKSALTLRYLRNNFCEDYDPTISKTYYHTLNFQGIDYRLTIYDTAGLENQSPQIPDRYIRDSHGYILVYSIADQQSFDTIKDVYRTIISETNRTNVPLVLVGNKFDLEQDRIISVLEGQELAKEWQASFLETSAKVGIKVNDIFTTCINAVDRTNNDRNTTNQQQQQQQRALQNNQPVRASQTTQQQPLRKTSQNKVIPTTPQTKEKGQCIIT